MVMNRRRFIRNSTCLGAGVVLPGSLGRSAFAASLPADLVDLSALELSRAIRENQVSCTEVMQAYLAHIYRYNPTYNAIINMLPEDELMAQARQADAALDRGDYQGWMHGMPHAVKDLTPAAGLLYTSGSPMYAERVAEADGSLAASLRGAGALFIGKTNVPEFGLGSQSYNSLYGATGSAWNPELTAGGSSGGAASGLGTHMLPVADGSDMMGSLRNPGAFNNVIGFRPSTSVMRENDGPQRALSTSGPMGRNMADTIQLLETIAVNPVGSNFRPRELAGTRIGWLGNFEGYLAMENGILELCENALQLTEEAGARVQAMQPDFDPADLWQCWTTLRHSGRDGYREFYDDPARRPLLKPELIYEIEDGMAMREDDVAEARAIRGNWYRELQRLFDQYDFLVLPTAQVFPFPKTVRWPREINGRSMDTYHRWMEVVIPGSLGGLPVLNVPVGFDQQDRPMGMQIMGPYGADQRVLEFGLAYEGITDFLQRRPRLVA